MTWWSEWLLPRWHPFIVEVPVSIFEWLFYDTLASCKWLVSRPSRGYTGIGLLVILNCMHPRLEAWGWNYGDPTQCLSSIHFTVSASFIHPFLLRHTTTSGTLLSTGMGDQQSLNTIKSFLALAIAPRITVNRPLLCQLFEWTDTERHQLEPLLCLPACEARVESHLYCLWKIKHIDAVASSSWSVNKGWYLGDKVLL